jgi:hypothetical protein
MRFFARLALASPLIGFLSPMLAYAQNPQVITNLPGCDFITGNMQARCIPIFVGHLIQLLFGLISVFFLINVMVAGYQIATGAWTGSGNTAGKDRLKYSIIGLVVSVCCYLILNLVVTIISP